MKYRKGYRLMTLGWTDGNTFLPINSCLLASSKEHNLIGPVEQFDGRSLAANRMKFARMKGTEVMIELLRSALSTGHTADYVLFDTWFPSPAQLIAVENLGLDSITMIRKSSRIYYEYEGKQLSIKKIFGICKKHSGRSKYLLSVNAEDHESYDDTPWIDEAVVDAMLDGNIMRLGNPFYIDLDSDGQWEYVSLERGDDDWAPQSEDYYNGTYWIAIDGDYLEGYGENIQTSVYGVSLDGKRIDLIVFQEGPSEDPICDFYRLADYGPMYCGGIADDIEDLVITEYGTVTGSVRTHIMDTSRIQMEWEKDSDGMLYPVEQDIYELEPDHLPSSYADILPYYAQLLYPLEVSEDVSKQGNTIVIEPQPVYFPYTDNERMVFVQAMDGTGGWLNVEGWTTQDKTGWFEGLWFAG